MKLNNPNDPRNPISRFYRCSLSRGVERDLGVFIEPTPYPVRSPNEQLAVYDEDGLWVGDVMSDGDLFTDAELTRKVRELCMSVQRAPNLTVAHQRRFAGGEGLSLKELRKCERTCGVFLVAPIEVSSGSKQKFGVINGNHWMGNHLGEVVAFGKHFTTDELKRAIWELRDSC